jgi:RNA polymerase sigma-70 factor (ECF subfamily)
VGAALAEEVAAEAFARAFAARKRYDTAHPDALPSLLGIATNLMRRHWRAERRRRRRTSNSRAAAARHGC